MTTMNQTVIQMKMTEDQFQQGLVRILEYHFKTKEMFTKAMKNNAEEPLGPLCGKVNKIIPHVPYYLTEGNVIQKKWREPFVDRVGNKAELTKVLFRTKKGKENEVVIQVKWE